MASSLSTVKLLEPAMLERRPFTTKTAADYLRAPSAEVRNLRSRGKLQHFRLDGDDCAANKSGHGRCAISCLPPSLPPRGLSRVQAAEYIGIGTTKFDELVADGRMPKPKRIDGRAVWDRIKLDEAFAALDGDDAIGNEWDQL